MRYPLILVVCVALGVGLTALPDGARAQTAADPVPNIEVGLIGDYPFTSGPQDSSSFHRDALPSAAVHYDENGVSLGGTDGFLDFPGYPQTTQSYSVFGWIRATSLSPSSDGKPRAVNRLAFGGFSVRYPDGKILFALDTMRGSIRGDTFPIVSKQSVAVGKWVPVALTVDGTSGAYHLYVDGLEDSSGTARLDPGTPAQRLTPMSPGYNDGIYHHLAAGGAWLATPFTGNVRDVRFYDRALNADQIRYLSRPDPALIASFAPLIYLHPQERYFPSTVDEFAANLHMVCDFKEVATPLLALKQGDLPADGAECFMSTNSEMHGPYDMKPFFAGHRPTDVSVPVYVFLYDVVGRNSFTVQYDTFYPWNQGKMGCTGLAPGDNCVGQRIEFGDHVGDWELMTIRILNGEPVEVHVGAHGNDGPNTDDNFLTASTYLKRKNWKEYPVVSGSEPQTLSWEGRHPIVYSAAGSHGIWATPGTHTYRTLKTGDRLNDNAGAGERWTSWSNLVLAAVQGGAATRWIPIEPRYAFLLTGYRGGWGNFHQGKDPCDFTPLGDFVCRQMGIPVGSEYQLVDGPFLPDRDRDRRYMTECPAGTTRCDAP